MKRKQSDELNFLAILAFGVMVLSAFVATNMIGSQTQTSVNAEVLGAGAR